MMETVPNNIQHAKRRGLLNRAAAFLATFRLDKVLAVFVAGALLMLNVACSTGNEVGARPNNLPVQMGGENNPYKRGGDGYTDYKASTDPAAKAGQKRASLELNDRLVAVASTDRSTIQYPGSGETEIPQPGEVSKAERDALMTPGQIPAKRQPVIDRSDPNAKILERTGKAFTEASKFLNEPPERPAHPSTAQPNPGSTTAQPRPH